ncbi:class I SAM-dependent methyltransferase [Roseomonas populi]|uniref:Class I SAM-dependent methyltransferase n=1 Tax=Roseomonas populi TaxID=3121582 RepID=A0ABT1XBD9_9PROT|nr:class I SAM-dependent methyltransferase [Roseomonas pecuniae]MCR0985229.1 class I SAM-dependent methyltransferase [Roseomonas pecuniae]
MATREDVLACYRYIFGREPESETALNAHVFDGESLDQLRARFFGSEEFLQKTRISMHRPPRPLPYVVPPLKVEDRASPEVLRRLMEKTAAYWTAIGVQAPHWSVLTSEIYRPERIEGTKEHFYNTGRDDLNLIRACLRRARVPLDSVGTVLEYGCGVGRVTLHLARKFPRVIACDISRPHLDLAAAHLTEVGAPAAQYEHLGPDRLHPDVRCDLWFSRIVLQHNPPPVIAAILQRAFASLNPGGTAVFQVPTYRVDYAFRTEEYLAGPLGQHMEMHVLPQPAIFALADAGGCRPVEVREDTRVVSGDVDKWLSNLFVFRKAGTPVPRPVSGPLSGPVSG